MEKKTDCWLCERKNITRTAKVDGQDVCRNCFMASRDYYLVICRSCKKIRFAKKTDLNLTSICTKMVQYNSTTVGDTTNELKVNMAIAWAKSTNMKMFELLKCKCKEEYSGEGIA